MCPTLCNPMDCSLPGSSVHGIFQSRVLEWIAISFSRGSSRPRNQTRVSCIAGRRFTIWATREAQRKKGENTEPNTYGFRLENALLNTHTSEEDPAITVHYEQKSRGYEQCRCRSSLTGRGRLALSVIRCLVSECDQLQTEMRAKSWPHEFLHMYDLEKVIWFLSIF